MNRSQILWKGLAVFLLPTIVGVAADRISTSGTDLSGGRSEWDVPVAQPEYFEKYDPARISTLNLQYQELIQRNPVAMNHHLDEWLKSAEDYRSFEAPRHQSYRYSSYGPDRAAGKSRRGRVSARGRQPKHLDAAFNGAFKKRYGKDVPRAEFDRFIQEQETSHNRRREIGRARTQDEKEVAAYLKAAEEAKRRRKSPPPRPTGKAGELLTLVENINRAKHLQGVQKEMSACSPLTVDALMAKAEEERDYDNQDEAIFKAIYNRGSEIYHSCTDQYFQDASGALGMIGALKESVEQDRYDRLFDEMIESVMKQQIEAHLDFHFRVRPMVTRNGKRIPNPDHRIRPATVIESLCGKGDELHCRIADLPRYQAYAAAYLKELDRQEAAAQAEGKTTISGYDDAANYINGVNRHRNELLKAASYKLRADNWRKGQWLRDIPFDEDKDKPPEQQRITPRAAMDEYERFSSQVKHVGLGHYMKTETIEKAVGKEKEIVDPINPFAKDHFRPHDMIQGGLMADAQKELRWILRKEVEDLMEMRDGAEADEVKTEDGVEYDYRDARNNIRRLMIRWPPSFGDVAFSRGSTENFGEEFCELFQSLGQHEEPKRSKWQLAGFIAGQVGLFVGGGIAVAAGGPVTMALGTVAIAGGLHWGYHEARRNAGLSWDRKTDMDEFIDSYRAGRIGEYFPDEMKEYQSRANMAAVAIAAEFGFLALDGITLGGAVRKLGTELTAEAVEAGVRTVTRKTIGAGLQAGAKGVKKISVGAAKTVTAIYEAIANSPTLMKRLANWTKKKRDRILGWLVKTEDPELADDVLKTMAKSTDDEFEVVAKQLDEAGVHCSQRRKAAFVPTLKQMKEDLLIQIAFHR